MPAASAGNGDRTAESSPRARALVLAPQPFFTPRGTPFSVYYRTLVLAEQGIQVDLLTYGEGSTPVIPGVRVIRIPHPGWLRPVRIGPSAAKAVLDAIMVPWTIGLLLRRRYDFIHAHEEMVFLARLLSPLFRLPLVYDMHSSLPQQLRNFEFTNSRLLVGLFARLERWSVRGSAAVLTICPDLAEQALALGIAPDRHFLVENSIFEPVRLAESELGSPAGRGSGAAAAAGDSPGEVAARELPADRPLVVYAGTLETYQGIDLVLEAAARLVKDADRPADAAPMLVLAGGSDQQIEHYRQLAAELGLGTDHVRFLGRLPKAAAMDLLGRATVVLSPRVSGTNTPLKVYELLAGGAPMLATRIHSHTQVLDDTVCVLAKPEPEAMAAGLAALLDDPELRARLSAEARALYDRSYARPIYESKIAAMLDRVLGPRPEV